MNLRQATEEEKAAFVTSAWVNSYASSDWALSNTPKDPDHVRCCEACGAASFKTRKLASGIVVANAGRQYYDGHRELVRAICAASNVTVAQADDGLLDGFIVRDWRRPVLHYVYVRDSARGNGVARALVADLAGVATVCTHKSRGIKQARLPRGWRFNAYPLLLGAA